MADDKSKKVVRCTACGNFVLNGAFEGGAEVCCTNSRCGATVFVEMHGGIVTIKAEPKKARPAATT